MKAQGQPTTCQEPLKPSSQPPRPPSILIGCQEFKTYHENNSTTKLFYFLFKIMVNGITSTQGNLEVIIWGLRSLLNWAVEPYPSYNNHPISTTLEKSLKAILSDQHHDQHSGRTKTMAKIMIKKNTRSRPTPDEKVD